MVDILTVEQVKELYLALPTDVTLNDVPLDIESREILSYTIAYWEEAAGVNQGELIPVYELSVKMKPRQSAEFIIEYVYVPASELYMRPLARITAPVKKGDVITLLAADASQTLKKLGVADFDFALGSGVYIYDWFLDGEKIGSGQTLSNFVVPYSADERALSLTFELRVTDADSPNESFSTDKRVLDGETGIFLPAVSR
jgi:hypothetical protein